MKELIQQNKEWFTVVTVLFGMSVFTNGLLCVLLLRSKRPFGPLVVLLMNVFVANMIDSMLLYSSQILERKLGLQNISLDPAKIPKDQPCDYKRHWAIVLHIGMPFKISSHAAINILGMVICLYMRDLFPDAQGNIRYFTRHKACDYVALSWLLSFFLMWHPMLITCADKISFHFALYSWVLCYFLAIIVSAALCFANCHRLACQRMDLYQLASGGRSWRRCENATILLVVFILLIITVPWPIMEMFEIKGWKYLISDLYPKAVSDGYDWVGLTLKPILRNMSYCFYLIQPLLYTIGFREIQERVRNPTAKTDYELSPGMRRQLSTSRITSV